MGKVNNDDIKCDKTPQTKVGTICGCNCIGDTSQDAADHEAVFLKTEIQNCIIHQLHNSSKDVSYKNLKALMVEGKPSRVDFATFDIRLRPYIISKATADNPLSP